MSNASLGAPQPIVHTDIGGVNPAPAATVPPTLGEDYGIPVYANLGSSPLPVDQILTGASNFDTGQVSLNYSSATSVIASNTNRRSVLITNTDSAIDIYVGSASVTASTGQIIPPGYSLTIPTTAQIYAISATGTPTVSYIEVYD